MGVGVADIDLDTVTGRRRDGRGRGGHGHARGQPLTTKKNYLIFDFERRKLLIFAFSFMQETLSKSMF